ncbi:hypothetical protein AVEN_158644-1 [Araneus ventricosus]|uniref:Uncharacterized protein n=1 Tax=Araneus ventricosus TaxID=182803 RepID=A0A4Y2WZD7_ARAVE|nr:hypothetical protein AVEN_158644-1 [Araneus ventricosus]
MLKKARVDKLMKGRDGKVISCVLRLDGKELTHPVQLVIPLEVEQLACHWLSDAITKVGGLDMHSIAVYDTAGNDATRPTEIPLAYWVILCNHKIQYATGIVELERCRP